MVVSTNSHVLKTVERPILKNKKRLLKVRISEHFQHKRKVEEQSAIYKHTGNCEHFKGVKWISDISVSSFVEAVNTGV